MTRYRQLLKETWESFLQSLRYRTKTSQFGDYIGEDYKGNKYYELGARPEVGRRKPSRWFESKTPEDLMQEVPPEWESWLRGRRDNPPTEEEIVRNMAIAEMKKKNVAKKENNEPKSGEEEKLYETDVNRYPKFKDYETFPGQHHKDKNHK